MWDAGSNSSSELWQKRRRKFPWVATICWIPFITSFAVFVGAVELGFIFSVRNRCWEIDADAAVARVAIYDSGSSPGALGWLVSRPGGYAGIPCVLDFDWSVPQTRALRPGYLYEDRFVYVTIIDQPVRPPRRTRWQRVSFPFVVILFFTGIPPAVSAARSAERLLARMRQKAARRRAAASNRCIGCGYNLTGNISGICPECGRGVD